MTGLQKAQLSAAETNEEGTRLWMALFALRSLNAKWHLRNNDNRVITQTDALKLHASHRDIVRDFMCEMGRVMPGDAR